MSEERTMPVGEIANVIGAAGGAGAGAPASGAGTELETRKAAPGEQESPLEGGAGAGSTPGAPDGGQASQEAVSPEAMKVAAETRRRLDEIASKETQLKLQEMQAAIRAERDPARQRQLAAQYEAHLMLQTDAYMTRFARQHGIEPGDPLTRVEGASGDSRVNWNAGSQAEFEASVLAAANEDAAGRIAELEKRAKRVEALEADLPNLVKSILANEGASGRHTDPGDGGAPSGVKDWTTATPEQVQRMREELRRRR